LGWCFFCLLYYIEHEKKLGSDFIPILRDVESVTAAKKHGVTAYIRKPISSKQLEAKLRVILYKMAA